MWTHTTIIFLFTSFIIFCRRTSPMQIESDVTILDEERSLQVRSLIDEIIDLAVEKIKEDFQGAVNLTDVIKQFRKKILLIPIDAEIILYDGKLRGVDSIKRSGHSKFHFKHTKVDVTSSFQFDVLDFSYDFQAELFSLTTNGLMTGNITQLVADVDLLIDIPKKTIELTGLRLVKAKVLKIVIDSRNIADKFINYFLKLITSNFKTILLSQIEKELQSMIGTTIHVHFSSDE